MSRPNSGGFATSFDPMAQLAHATRKRQTPEKFWAKVDRSGGEAACWPWTGRTDHHGYGFLSWRWNEVGAHRLAYALAHGPIPEGQVVRHACDNPRCCNPAHLLLGTIADNNADARDRGRMAFGHLAKSGVDNSRAKLNDALVIALRRAWRAGESIKSICLRTGLSVGTIHPMLHRKTWRHVSEPSDCATAPDEAARALCPEVRP